MFTSINIYETILNKYYVHHILKNCIYTGMTATTKLVLCLTRQHLNLPVVILVTSFIQSVKPCSLGEIHSNKGTYINIKYKTEVV